MLVRYGEKDVWKEEASVVNAFFGKSNSAFRQVLNGANEILVSEMCWLVFL